MEYGEEEDIFELLDDNILEDLDGENELYGNFYSNDVRKIKVYFIYVGGSDDKYKEIYHIKKHTMRLSDNALIDRMDLIGMINNYKVYNKKNHRLISLLKYNITMKPGEIIHFLKRTQTDTFLQKANNLNTVKWDDSISFFNDLNSMYFIYSLNKKKRNNTTKKITINPHNKYVKKSRKKTRKNKLN
jgi:hypothetical protein